MAEIVYALCATTSIVCAFLLLRNHRRTRSRLLLWSGICFIGLALNNVLLFMDLVVATGIDLSAGRDLTAFGGISVLALGLLWDSR
jgi:drug/metabolite transporter superfamily protein YnfA